jgi:hypothetical protein
LPSLAVVGPRHAGREERRADVRRHARRGCGEDATSVFFETDRAHGHIAFGQ